MKLKTTQKILIGLPIAVGLVLIIRQLTKKPKETPAPTPSDEPIFTGGGTPSPSSNDSFPLKKGSKGYNVTRLQTALKKLNASALPRYGVDGDFGSETESALKAQTGKTTCTSAELVNLELLASRATGTWYPPMANPDNTTPLPPFGF